MNSTMLFIMSCRSSVLYKVFVITANIVSRVYFIYLLLVDACELLALIFHQTNRVKVLVFQYVSNRIKVMPVQSIKSDTMLAHTFSLVKRKR